MRKNKTKIDSDCILCVSYTCLLYTYMSNYNIWFRPLLNEWTYIWKRELKRIHASRMLNKISDCMDHPQNFSMTFDLSQLAWHERNKYTLIFKLL